MSEETKHMTEEEKKDKQYEWLIAARNFHYENLNRWLITFYAIIGALFVALYHIHGSHHLMELCVAIVGYVVSIAALLSGKGYYYWETNWIMLIHQYEQIEIDRNVDKVYSIFANKEANNQAYNPFAGANISTTKVTLAITTFIAVLWGVIVFYFSVFPNGTKEDFAIHITISVIVSAIVTFVAMLLGALFFPSNLDNIADLEIKTKNDHMNTLKKRIRTIAIVGVLVIALIIVTLVLLENQFNLFQTPVQFYTSIGLSLAAITVAIIGVYVTYTIQSTIIKINASHRKQDEFTKRLKVYADGMDAVNKSFLEYQKEAKKKDPAKGVLIASANVLCSQAYLTYYAFLDLIDCAYFKEQFGNSQEIKVYAEDIPSFLSKISDNAYIGMTDTSVMSDILGFVGSLNSESADLQRAIYKVLYPNMVNMSERTM